MLNLQKNSRFTFIVVLILTMFFVVATTPQKVRAITNCDVPSTLLTQTTKEAELLGLINTYRQQNNLGALIWSDTLKKAAAWQSNDMSTNSSFTHTDSLGRSPETRINDCGYQFTAYGENIEKGDSTAQAVFTAWKNSPTHNAIMLLATVREAGIASVNNYWTLDVGSSNTPLPTGSIITPAPSSSPSATPKLTPTPEVNTNPTDTQINIKVKFPGIGETGNKSPIHLTREVTVGIFDSDNKLVLTGNGFLKYDQKNLFEGVIHLGQLADGIYSIKIKSTNTLVSLVFPQFQNLTHEDVNVLPFTALTAGDLNNDNIIDIKDYNLALPCFQNSNCSVKVDTDLNDDLKSNVIDYNLFLSNFRQYEGD